MEKLFDSQNHLFELARRGQRLPHLLVAIVVSVAMIIIAQLVGGIPAILIILQLSDVSLAELTQSDPQMMQQLLLPDTALEQFLFLTLGFGPIFLLLWGWLALVERRPLWTLGLERATLWQNYLRGAGVGLAMFGAAVGLSAAFGFMAFEAGGSQPVGLAALGGVLLVLLGWVVQGAAEEALARGWLLPVIGARYRPAIGVAVSSLIFAAFHSLNPNLSGVALLNLFLFGLFTALYALAEGGLWGVFSIHTVWNWAQGNLFGLEVSGSPAPGGAVINLQEVGPDLITGGAFGPEGGLAVTAVLVVSCLLVWWWAKTD